jgi:NADPH2:quinone reductase
MRQLHATHYGPPRVLHVTETDPPEQKEGSVRVRMAAAAINPADIRIRQGALADRLPTLAFPFRLGFDIAGTLLDEAPGLPAASRVVGLLPWFARPGFGSNSEVIVVEPEWLAPLPDGIAWPLAGTLPLSALTAAQALDLTHIEADQTLLVSGASGAVGAFATQLALAKGANVIAVASTGDEEFVASLGATVVPRGDAEVVAAAVQRIAREGVDAVFDAAGIGSRLLCSVVDGGSFVAASAPAAPASERNVRVAGVQSHPDAERLAEIARLVGTGRLVSRVEQVFPLEDAVAAHERVERGGLRGKVVLTFG